MTRGSMKPLKIADLNRLYDEADSVDREYFSEARSNVLLLAGEHFRRDRGSPNTRGPNSAAQDAVKLRIVKNHIHKVVRHYVTSILSLAPGVSIGPAQETDLQDQKDAELNQAVWESEKQTNRISEKIRQWALDFICGEVAVKIYWDPNAGELKGYEQAIGESGEPLFDEMGQPVPDDTRPIFAGKFCFDRIFAANLLRHASTKDMRDNPCWIIRKMVKTADLKARYKNDPDKLKGITENQDETYIVFDSQKAGYDRNKDETLVKEYYWKPCVEYPEGYFCIATSTVILEEGPLPYGIFPIAWAGFDEFPTSPRAHSIIKVARPFVAEVSRASSAMAQAQVSIGDDKILYQTGTKLSQGSLLPGVRGITYQGREPQILPGRTGAQYQEYIAQTIAEMYSVLMLEEINETKDSNLDPMSQLFRSAKQQRKFSFYAEKFEQFLIDVVTIFLDLARYYLPDDALIPAIGMREMINIQEFRNTSPLRTKIKVEAKTDTLETMMGKTIVFQNTLQYVGKQLNRDDIGKLLKEMPFGNTKEAFDDFTLSWENAKNDMLALERGSYPPISPYDDPKYMVGKLSARMRRPDFQFLPPQVQMLYQKRISDYEALEAQQMQKLQAAEADYIPTDGTMVACDVYVANPNKPDETPKRARVPQRALEWLIQRLNDQGTALQAIEDQPMGAQAQLAGLLQQMGGMPSPHLLPPLNNQPPAGSGQIQPSAANTLATDPRAMMAG